MFERLNLIDTSELEAQISHLNERVHDIETTLDSVTAPEPDPDLPRSPLEGMTEVHLINDLECGPEDDIGAAISQHVHDRPPDERNHRYVVPGTPTWEWHWGSQIDPGDYRGFAVVGEPHARVHVGPDVGLLVRLNGDRHALTDLTFDMRGEEADAGIARVSTRVSGEFRNLSVVGQRDRHGLEGDRFVLRINAIHEDAENVVQSVLLPDGDTHYEAEGNVGHAIPMSSEQGHIGTNHWRGCFVQGFSDNAYYMAGGEGPNHLDACVAKDNAGPLLRLGDGDSAKNCRIIQHDPPGKWVGFWAQDGPCEFEDCSAEVTAPKTNEILRDTARGHTRWEDILISDRSPSRGRACRFDGSGRTDVIRLTIEDRTDPESGDYMVHLNHGNVHFEDCTFSNHSKGKRHAIVAKTTAINRCSFEGCSFEGQEHAAINLRDDAIDWDVRNNRFKPSGRVIVSGNTSEFVWAYNRHNGEDSFTGRATGWVGAGTNIGLASFPGDSGN